MIIGNMKYFKNRLIYLGILLILSVAFIYGLITSQALTILLSGIFRLSHICLGLILWSGGDL